MICSVKRLIGYERKVAALGFMPYQIVRLRMILGMRNHLGKHKHILETCLASQMRQSVGLRVESRIFNRNGLSLPYCFLW